MDSGTKAALGCLRGHLRTCPVPTGALSFVTAVFGFDGSKLGDFKDLVLKWRGGFFSFVRFERQTTS